MCEHTASETRMLLFARMSMLYKRTRYLFTKNSTAAPVIFLPQKSRTSFPIVMQYSYITITLLRSAIRQLSTRLLSNWTGLTTDGN